MTELLPLINSGILTNTEADVWLPQGPGWGEVRWGPEREGRKVTTEKGFKLKETSSSVTRCAYRLGLLGFQEELKTKTNR